MSRLTTRTVLLLALATASIPGRASPLDQYVAEALQANPALQAQDATVREQWARFEAARQQRLPSLSLSARHTWAEGGRTIDFPSGELLNPVYQTLNDMLVAQGEAPRFPQIDNVSIPLLRAREHDTRLSLVAPLYAPGLGAARDVAAHQADAARAARESFARQLVREVHRAWYAAGRADAGIGILEASEATLAEDVRVATSLVQAGKATRDRIVRAEAERLAVRQRLDAARHQRAQAIRLLNALRDQPADADVALPERDALAMPPAGPSAPATSRRAELAQLDAGVAAAEAGTLAARAERRPTLSLAADYGFEGERYRFGSDDDFATVSLVLRWTLFDFGSRAAQADAARAAADALRARRRDLERQLDLERDNALDTLDTALQAVATASARASAAEESFRIATRKRDAGSLPQIAFLDAERALTEARLGQAIARFEALDAAAELDRVLAHYPLPPDTRSAPARSTP